MRADCMRNNNQSFMAIELDVRQLCTRSTTNADELDLSAVANLLVNLGCYCRRQKMTGRADLLVVKASLVVLRRLSIAPLGGFPEGLARLSWRCRPTSICAPLTWPGSAISFATNYSPVAPATSTALRGCHSNRVTSLHPANFCRLTME